MRSLTVVTTIFLLFFELIWAQETISPPNNRYIVVFEKDTPIKERRTILQHAGTIINEFEIIPGAVVVLPEVASDKALQTILSHAGVMRIEKDIIVKAIETPFESLAKTPPQPKPLPPEVLPWGIDRIDAENIWANSTGSMVKIAVIDTGIDIDHPDLLENIAGGTNIINPRKLYDDDNGHGTHVGGIIAGTDNTIGVIGVAPEAKLYGVKCLDRSGNGFLSNIISGLEWSINNGMKVINMSLGASGYSAAFHDAVKAVYNADIVIVAAAGNEGGPLIYPAAFPEVIAVAATDSINNIPSWSNFGSEIDIAAPGVSIYSTYRGGVFATMSGTSMAAPHVAGVAALLIELSPLLKPAEIAHVLSLTAENIGLPAEFQGAGIVDAEYAVIYLLQ